MKTGFSDPIKAKEGKTIKTPWNYEQPPYDERSSCYVNVGTNYGEGHRQPVGHPGNARQRVPTMPFGRVNTEETDKVYMGEPELFEVNE